MAANQVVLYFDKQEDALLFHLGCQFGYVSGRTGPQRATQWSRLRRRFAKPVESRLRVF